MEGSEAYLPMHPSWPEVKQGAFESMFIKAWDSETKEVLRVEEVTGE